MAKLFIPKRLFSAHEKKTGGEDRRKWKNASYGCTTILLYFSLGSPMMRI